MKTKNSKAPEPGELRERALGLLARREHSRFELARKLERAGFEEADIGALLDEFEQKNWLSDRRFAESWVADHRAKAGSVKLAFELRQRGVAEDVIAAVLGEQRESELERAHGFTYIGDEKLAASMSVGANDEDTFLVDTSEEFRSIVVELDRS